MSLPDNIIAQCRLETTVFILRDTNNQIAPCPPCSSRWAACCDTLGRVLLADVASCVVLRMLKGYRDALAAWLVPCGGEHEPALLVVFAPRRGAVELWRARAGVRIGSIPTATQRAMLLTQPALPVAPEAGKASAPSWRAHHPNACWLLDLETLELTDLTPALTALWTKAAEKTR